MTNTTSTPAYIGSCLIGTIEKDGTLSFSSAAMGGRKFKTTERPTTKPGVERASQFRNTRVARIEGARHHKVNARGMILVAIVGETAMVEIVELRQSYGTCEVCDLATARALWKKHGPALSKEEVYALANAPVPA